ELAGPVPTKDGPLRWVIAAVAEATQEPSIRHVEAEQSPGALDPAWRDLDDVRRRLGVRSFQEPGDGDPAIGAPRDRSQGLVHAREVVPQRLVRAPPRGHLGQFGRAVAVREAVP